MIFISDQKRIVVNADDFGWHKQVTDAILECFTNGTISQSTLLVNMPYCETAVERARAAGVENRIGLHLNFTDGEPLTAPIRRFSEVCDENGNFRRHAFGNGLAPLRGQIAEAIRTEARAQIEKYCSMSLPLMHCDGHHHVHNRLQFACIVLPLLKEFGFKSVRNRYSIFTRPWIRGIRGRIRIGVFETLVRHYGLQTTSGFGDWEGESLMRWSIFPSVELMVHPNYDTAGRNVNVTDFGKVEGPEMCKLKEYLDAFEFNRKAVV